MKKLEKKIIKGIYKMETKRTLSQIVGRVLSMAIVIISAVFIFSVIVEILNEQRSFDLLDFYRDDFEVVRHFFVRNTSLFMQELPLPLVCILILLVVALIVLIYILARNFKKLKNKLISLYKFWFK